MMLNHIPLVQFIINYLNLLGINPFNGLNYFRIICLLFMATSTNILAIILLIVEPFNYTTFADAMETIATTTHAIVKYLFLLQKQQQLRNCLDLTKHFMTLDDFNDDFKLEGSNYLKRIKKIKDFFTIFAPASAFFFLLRPFMMNELVMACFVPAFIPFTIFKIFNSVVFLVVSLMIVCFDLLSFILISLTSFQFKCVGEKVNELKLAEIETLEDEENCIKKLNTYVQYHYFLYSYLQVMNSLIGWTVLATTMIITWTVTFELFISAVGAQNLLAVIKSYLYISGVFLELLIYSCWPANTLTEEADKFSTTIYNCKWYECKSNKIKKILILMMTRTQKKANVSVGTIFEVDLTTCTQAFKAAFSYYTTLRIINQKSV